MPQQVSSPGMSFLFLFVSSVCSAQLKWQNVDSLYQPLPPSVHVYFTNDKVDSGNFRAFYLVADLKDKKLDFAADTSFKRRLTPTQFYERNTRPLAVVNCTFFEFEHNSNLNLVVNNGDILAYNHTTTALKGKDTFTYAHTFHSAIGITKKKKGRRSLDLYTPVKRQALCFTDATTGHHRLERKL